MSVGDKGPYWKSGGIGDKGQKGVNGLDGPI